MLTHMLESEACFSRDRQSNRREALGPWRRHSVPPTKVGREAGPSGFIGVPGRRASGLPGWIGQFTLEERGFGESHGV